MSNNPARRGTLCLNSRGDYYEMVRASRNNAALTPAPNWQVYQADSSAKFDSLKPTPGWTGGHELALLY